jgi:hypothetical protein
MVVVRCAERQERRLISEDSGAGAGHYDESIPGEENTLSQVARRHRGLNSEDSEAG